MEQMDAPKPTAQKIMQTVVVVSMYPMKRAQQVYSNRLKLFNHLHQNYEWIQEIHPDHTQDDGFRSGKRIRKYDAFYKRIRSGNVLNVMCKMKGSNTYAYMSIKVFKML